MKILHCKLMFFLFCFYTSDRGAIYLFNIPNSNNFILHLPEKLFVSDDIQLFGFLSFDLPYLFAWLNQKFISKFILVIPSFFNEHSTISEKSFYTEGVRNALAWCSIFTRFKILSNLDIRILLYRESDDSEIIKNNIEQTLSLEFKTSSSPEKEIEQRIITTNSLLNNQSLLTLAPFEVNIPNPVPHLIKTKFDLMKTTTRIVITGGAGFIGSHLVQQFLEQQYEIIVLDNLSCSSGENIKQFQENPLFEFIHFDVTKPFEIEGPIDIIAHLASEPSPVNYYAKPIETMNSGLFGTKYCLELARKKNARFFLASTSEVYGDPKVHPQKESYHGNVSPIGKRSQYDQSKRGAETLCKFYFDRYNIDIRIARIFNTYGPGMQIHDGRVITNFIQAVLFKKPMTIYGDGTQTRSPIYISDMVKGLTQLIESELITSFTSISQRIFNIGNPEEYSINQIADMVNKISLQYKNTETPITHIPQFDTTDPMVRCPDILYIHKVTGFYPQVSFQDGLQKMFNHYEFFLK